MHELWVLCIMTHIFVSQHRYMAHLLPFLDVNVPSLFPLDYNIKLSDIYQQKERPVNILCGPTLEHQETHLCREHHSIIPRQKEKTNL